MQYRREIDGLRAVAVIPVIFFHAGVHVFSGGYVGVDIFFVISGYLITSILIAELDAGQFSILNFYERRARRILPALFFVMLCCIPFAWVWMMPTQLKDFAQSLIAVVFFASNILFWRETDYFSASAELKPLLHTWSLAVEEQYYLLFPVFLLLIWRFGRNHAFYTVLFTAFASLMLSEWGWRNAPTANFYLAHTRAWELLAGSLCAFLAVTYPQWRSNILSAVGLAMIIFAILFYNHATPFPSIFSLVPVVGSVLIILFGTTGTWVAIILSSRGFVGLGLISYSAYLWHQPLFALARIRSILEPAAWLMFALAIASLALAYLSWRFIEQPFRKGSTSILQRRSAVFGVSIVMGAAFVILGSIGHLTRGLPDRLPPNVLDVLNVQIGDTSDCYNRFTAYDILAGKQCVIGNDSAASTIAIIGDSHVGRITDALSHRLAGEGLSAATFNSGWCVPLMNFARLTYWQDNCLNMINATFEQVTNSDTIKTVVLFAEWSNYTEGYRFGEHTISSYTYSEEVPFRASNSTPENNPEQFERALHKSLSALQAADLNIILVTSTPEYSFEVPNAIAATLLFSSNAGLQKLDLPKSEYLSRNAVSRRIILSAASSFDVNVVDAFSLYCSKVACKPYDEQGMPLYTDTNHLGFKGSKPLVDLIVKTILRQ